MYKLSVRDINFIRPFYTYLNLFLITPWNDFDENTVLKLNVVKVYGCALIVLKISSIMYVGKIGIERNLAENMAVSQVIIIFVSQIILVTLTILTIFKSTFTDSARWRLIFNNFQLIDKKLHNLGVVELSILENFYTRCFIKHTVFFIFVGYILYGWLQLIKSTFLKLVLANTVSDFYYEFLISVLIHTVVKALKSRHQDLNIRLIYLSRKPTVAQEMRKVVLQYRLLGETTEMFSSMFGYQILLIIFHCGLVVITSLNNCFLFLMAPNNHRQLTVYFFTCNLCMFMYIVWILSTLILPVEATTQESKTFKDLCYKIHENVINKSAEFQVVKKLTLRAEHFQRKFNAAGHFEINKTLIFSFVGNVMTYFIVVVQLNGIDLFKRNTT
ncbi:hypothetical protein Zmor_019774 [Zophobas morio]|uniref:Gustatory receptor n=1 Tax=Zophobas morio TaxID=2755281 RepID=A0AA38I270_9CUCU|nr:hypothetical protein Zmor_019774 [Zophobas morio]